MIFRISIPPADTILYPEVVAEHKNVSKCREVVVAERGATMTLYILGTVSGNLVQSFEVCILRSSLAPAASAEKELRPYTPEGPEYR